MLLRLHSEIQNTNCIIGKTGSDLVTLLIPTDLKNASITSVGFNDLAFLQGPYEHRSVRRPTGYVLTIGTECNRIYTISVGTNKQIGIKGIGYIKKNSLLAVSFTA